MRPPLSATGIGLPVANSPYHLAAETAPHLLEQLAERRVILRLAQRLLAANGVHLQLMIDDHLLPVAPPRHAIVARRIADCLSCGMAMIGTLAGNCGR